MRALLTRILIWLGFKRPNKTQPATIQSGGPGTTPPPPEADR